jgi:uncharacterized protein (DUF736 family)
MPRNPDEIGAMWEKTSGRGPYMTGTINGERVVMFKQTDKTNDKAPDWRVLKAKPREAVSQPDGHADEPVAPITAEDVPF